MAWEKPDTSKAKASASNTALRSATMDNCRRWPLSSFGGRVAVLVAGSDPTALAAKAATSNIPIVFAVGSDPIKLGLVASVSRPGGNATGMNIVTSALEAKRLGLLHELMPQAAIIGVLVNPNNSTTEIS